MRFRIVSFTVENKIYDYYRAEESKPNNRLNNNYGHHTTAFFPIDMYMLFALFPSSKIDIPR